MANTFTKVVANFSTNLTSNISVGGTTASIASNLTKDNLSLPNGRYCFTVNQGKSNEMHFICNLTGTSITAIETVNRLGGLTSGAALDAKINDEIKITDYVNLLYLVQDVEALNATVAGIIVTGAPDANTTTKGVVRLTASPNKVLGTPTITIATPAVFTLSSHGLTVDDSVVLSTTGALPTGLTVSTTYYVISSGLSANEFKLSTTLGGSPINTSGSQSGTHTITRTTPRAISENDTTLLPSTKEKQALVGTLGTPSTINPYITLDNTSEANVEQVQATQNASIELGEADATNKKKDIAQSFIPNKTKIKGVKLYKMSNTGTFTGTVTLELQADSSGNPTGVALASVTLTNTQYNNIPVGEFTAIFTEEYQTLNTNLLYWIVIKTSTSDNSNRPNLGTNSSGGYTNGTVKYRNTIDGWISIPTIDLYFKTLEGTGGQVVKTNNVSKVVSTELLPSGLIDIDTSSISVTATTTGGSNLINMYSKYIPSGFFHANSGFKISIAGTSTPTSSNFMSSTEYRLKLNGTTISTITAASCVNGVTSSFTGDTNASFILLNQNSLNSQKIIRSFLTISQTYNNTSGQFPVRDHLHAAVDTATINTTNGVLLEIEGVAINGSFGVNTAISRNLIILEKLAY